MYKLLVSEDNKLLFCFIITKKHLFRAYRNRTIDLAVKVTSNYYIWFIKNIKPYICLYKLLRTSQGEEGAVQSAQDYYPFGMLMPSRTFSSDKYRFGFNGQEEDNEVSGQTGSYLNYKYRMYDCRIGRFIAVDPIKAKFPMLTPYQHSSLNPIWNNEFEGLEGIQYNVAVNINGKEIIIQRVVEVDIYVAVSKSKPTSYKQSDIAEIQNDYNAEYKSGKFYTKEGIPVVFKINVTSFDEDITTPKEFEKGLRNDKSNFLNTGEFGFKAVILEKGTVGTDPLGAVQGETGWMHSTISDDAINPSHSRAHELGHNFLLYDPNHAIQTSGANKESGHNRLGGIFRYSRDGQPVQEDVNQQNVYDFTNTLPKDDTKTFEIKSIEQKKGL